MYERKEKKKKPDVSQMKDFNSLVWKIIIEMK